MNPRDLEFLRGLQPSPDEWGGTGALLLHPDPRDYPVTAMPKIRRRLAVGAPTSGDLTGFIRGPATNQGQTPACVAYSTGQASSLDDEIDLGAWATSDGATLYREAGGDGSSGVDSRQTLEICRSRGTPMQGGSRLQVVGSYARMPQDAASFREAGKAAIAAEQPWVIALLLPQQFGWESGGAITSGYHQVVCCGYTADEKWIIFNSWGSGWGNNGLGKIPMAFTEQQNMQNGYCFGFVITPTVLPKPSPQPTPTPGPTPTPTPTPQPQPSPQPMPVDAAAEVLRLTNAARQQNNLPALALNPQLTKAAQDYAQLMASTNQFGHNLGGTTPDGRMRAAGYGAMQAWGENIAAGQPTPGGGTSPAWRTSSCSSAGATDSGVFYPSPGEGQSPGSVVNAWMNSPGHRANILNPAFKEIGIGFVQQQGSQYGLYWVQDFAAPSGGPTPTPTPTPTPVPTPTPTPTPQPSPGTLAVNGYQTSGTVATVKGGEVFAVHGRGFGSAGVLTVTLGGTPLVVQQRTDVSLTVTAPVSLLSFVTPVEVQVEGARASGPMLAVIGQGA